MGGRGRHGSMGRGKAMVTQRAGACLQGGGSKPAYQGQAQRPRGGVGTERSPITGLVVKSVSIAIYTLRAAFMNRGKECQTGIDKEGIPQAFEKDYQRLVSGLGRRGQDGQKQ